MENTIMKRLFFTSLDAGFNPCSREKAIYQLEEYVTNTGNVFAIAPFKNTYSYSIGQKIDTIPRVELNNELTLNNVIKNAYLNACIKNRAL